MNIISENRERVLGLLEKSEKTLADDVFIIKDWMKAQRHLPEMPSDRLIENFLLNNKFSIEQTKSKIDMYYTIRALMPECFKFKKPSLSHMKEISNVVYYFPLPKLTKDCYEVNVTKIVGEPKLFNVYNFFGHQMNINEVRLQEQIILGDVLIVDLEDTKLGHLVKITPIHLKKAVIILEKVFSNRIKQIHLVNVPKFIDKLIAILKTVLKQKLFERIYIHKTTDTLAKYISKDILPKDYGGNEQSIKKMNELWQQKLEKYSDRFEELEEMKVNESLRPPHLKNDDVLGYYGNFKKLDVD